MRLLIKQFKATSTVEKIAIIVVSIVFPIIGASILLAQAYTNKKSR